MCIVTIAYFYVDTNYNLSSLPTQEDLSYTVRTMPADPGH